MNKLTNKNKILKKVYLKGLSVSLSILTVTVFPVNAADNNTANNQPAAQETKQEINLKEKIGEKLKAIANNRAVRIAVGIGGVAAVVGVACALCKNNSKVTGTGAMKFSEAFLPKGIKYNEQYLDTIRAQLRSILSNVRRLQDNIGYGNRLWRPLFNCGNNIEDLLRETNGSGYYLTVERLEHINAQVVGFLENMRDLGKDSRRDLGVSRRLRNICNELVNLANFTGSNILDLPYFVDLPENPPAVQPEPKPVNSQVNPPVQPRPQPQLVNEPVQPRPQPINSQVNPPVQPRPQPINSQVNPPADQPEQELQEIRRRLNEINGEIGLIDNNRPPILLINCQFSIRFLLNEIVGNRDLTIERRRTIIITRLYGCLQNIRALYSNDEIRGRVGQELSNLFDRLVDLVHFIDPNRNRVVPPLQRQPEPQSVNSQVNPPVQPRPQPINLQVNPPVQQEPQPQLVNERVREIHNRLEEASDGIAQILNNILNNANNDVNTEQLDPLLDCQDKINSSLNETSENQVLTDIRRDNITDRLMSCLRNIRDLYSNDEIRGRVGQELSNLFDRLVDLVHFIDPNRNRVVPPLQRQPEPQPQPQSQPQRQPVNPPINRPVDQLPGTLRLSENGYNIYIQNMITRQVVDIHDKKTIETIGNKLRELCTQFNITKGIETDDKQNGWCQTPYQYFFVGNKDFVYSNMYHRSDLGDDTRKRLAQVIEVIYANKDKDNLYWKATIESVLTGMSAHGGHCGWRAVALVNQAYNVLIDNIQRANLDPNDNSNDKLLLFKEMFSNLKEAIVEDVKRLYLEDHRNDVEPLLVANAVESDVENMLGINRDGNGRNYYHNEAMTYFNRIMAKDELIKLSQNIMDSKFDENNYKELVEFFEDVDPVELNFTEYCDMVGKTPGNRELLRRKINGSDDNDLKEWVNDRKRLRVGNTSEENLGFISKLIELSSYNYNSIGCPEFDKIYGVKFIIKCIDNKYLELVN